ncbi:MAG: TonB-dependent receptor [Proteobacteria bacterium]|nr:TonB-dependent receptor [Pseudomonadota bacterium]
MNLSRQLGLLAVLLFGSISVAQALDPLQKSAFIDLPAQPLPQSLEYLGRRLSIDIPCNPKNCGRVLAPRVFGTQTARQALDTLLHGSGLHYEVLEDQRSIGIFASPSQSMAEPPEHPKVTHPAPAATSADTDRPPEEVLVTGSYISGLIDYHPPTITYSRRVIEESGVGSLEEFIARLPQNLNSNSRATYTIGDAQNAARGTSVNLRGLGERGTLVLIDGHRAAESAMGNFVDLSLIPLAAIDRIEVLSQGAAAIYGADAVAGVVNIVLLKDFTGAESSVRDTWPSHSGAHEFSAAQTVGEDWGGGNVVSSFTYRRADRLLSIDRPYSNTRGYTLLPELTDYDGHLFFHQDLWSHFHVDLDGLYSHRRTDDDADYILNGGRVGPYQQRGFTNQYYVAPTFKWASDSGWHAVADFDLSQNRFTETTTYGAEALSGAAIYSTLSEARVRTADGRFDGPVAHLRTGDVMMALGLGKRWEDYDSYGSGVASGSLSRHVAAAHGELYIPAVSSSNALPGLQRLDFSLSVRAEQYSGAGYTLNPKYDFLLQPVEHLSFRGSYGTSYATARFSQTLLGYNVLLIQPISSAACASGSCLVAEEFGANPSYRPERSKSYTVGFEWTPERPAGFRMRANYYAFNYRDQITAPPDADTLLAHAAAYSGIVVPNPTPGFLDGVFARAATYPQGVVNLAGPYTLDSIDYYIDQRTRNFARLLATGVDFDLAYDLPSSIGVWTLEMNGTRVIKLDDRASPVAPDVPVVDTFAHPVSRRYQAQVGLRSLLGITAQLRADYFGRYTNNQVNPAEPVPSWITFDASLMVPFDHFLSAPFRTARLELNIENFLNRDPPHVRTPYVPDGYDPVLANALGRVISLRFVVGLRGKS